MVEFAIAFALASNGADTSSGINRVSRFSNVCLITPYLESVARRHLDKFAASGTDLRNNVGEAEHRALGQCRDDLFP